MKKVANEVLSKGGIIDQSEVYQTRDVPRGPGSIALGGGVKLGTLTTHIQHWLVWDRFG